MISDKQATLIDSVAIKTIFPNVAVNYPLAANAYDLGFNGKLVADELGPGESLTLAILIPPGVDTSTTGTFTFVLFSEPDPDYLTGKPAGGWSTPTFDNNSRQIFMSPIYTVAQLKLGMNIQIPIPKVPPTTATGGGMGRYLGLGCAVGTAAMTDATMTIRAALVKDAPYNSTAFVSGFTVTS